MWTTRENAEPDFSEGTRTGAAVGSPGQWICNSVPPNTEWRHRETSLLPLELQRGTAQEGTPLTRHTELSSDFPPCAWETDTQQESRVTALAGRTGKCTDVTATLVYLLSGFAVIVVCRSFSNAGFSAQQATRITISVKRLPKNASDGVAHLKT